MVSLFKRDGGFGKLSDVIVPRKFFDRITVGVDALDFAFGGDTPGIVPGSSYLFTGNPGAGKSTLCLQLADWLRKGGRRVFYNIGEENVFMTKMRSDRIGVAGNFDIGQIEETGSLIERCRKDKTEVLIQDSLQSMRHGDLKGANLLRSVTKQLVRLSKDTDTVVILVGHLTKGGTFAGPNEIKHDVDAHAELVLDKNTGNRTFSLSKNRFGPACIPYELKLTERGIEFGKLDTEASVARGRVQKRRDEARVFVREKLLAGEKISGYCFQRFEYECSGGFWRAVLRETCEELRSQGYLIGETRIDGRLHNFVNN